ncbi:hypothetical protein EON66_11330 [archaeon]|nr:MAG: hypothetical protein EON66_11330 [archaeon]
MQDVRDLLVSSPSAAAAAAAAGKYEIKHDKDGNTSVVGLTVKEVRTMADVDALMKVAAAARSTGATHSNAHSSRSHSVYTMRLYLDHGVTAQSRSGILHMIDLAGSERIAKSGVNNMEAGGSEKLLKETQNINKSLSCLSTVVMALKAGASHVPFRNSKLTYLLQHSLGGNCKTLMLCNLNPLHAHTSESLATLRFAKAVTEVTNAPGAAGGVAAAGAGAAH